MSEIPEELVCAAEAAIKAAEWYATDEQLARAAIAVIVPMVEAAERERCVGIIATYKAQFLAGDPEKSLFNAGYIKGTEQACENIVAAIRKDAREMK